MTKLDILRRRLDEKINELFLRSKYKLYFSTTELKDILRDCIFRKKNVIDIINSQFDEMDSTTYTCFEGIQNAIDILNTEEIKTFNSFK